jgi:acetoacetyl-CoA synthetase
MIMTQTALWTPTQARIANTNMAHYQRYLTDKFGIKFNSYSDLHQWSVKNPKDFWSSIGHWGNVIQHSTASNALMHSEKMPGAQWFSGVSLNFAENLLAHADIAPDQAALIFHAENGSRREISYAQLKLQVTQLASSLKKLGVAKGDRVAGFLPNCIESIVAMLATTSLGGVWSSCSPDFGLQGVIDRFGQIEPKVLFACDGYLYNGKTIDTQDRLIDIVDQLSDLKQLIVVPFLHDCKIDNAPAIRINDAVTFASMLDTSASALTFESVDFNDPLYIMYSSGTTGVPKCIVHSVGGTLLQHIKELSLHTDLKAADKIFYFTTCGWMMWNWLVSSLSLGGTIVLFDGSPFYPSANRMPDLIDAEDIAIFGTSAKFISALEKAGVKPKKSHTLSNLKSILSTGSPLSHESFEYVYRDFKDDVCLSSISGGTDIISCFALGNPVLPVYAGELQCAGLGMDVQFYNQQGQANVAGEKGELVCRQPFPSMPIGFWNDTNGEKFHKAYFEAFENTWAHGDYGEFTEHKNGQNGVIIHGRSDAVLNPGGVRIGTAEIYRQVEKVDAVLESIAIGQQWQDDVRVVLFVRLRDGVTLDESLENIIKKTIRSNTTPRHVPAKIIQVSDIPRTISGKIVELAVRNVVHGEEVKNKDALANPEALVLFSNRPELQN